LLGYTNNSNNFGLNKKQFNSTYFALFSNFFIKVVILKIKVYLTRTYSYLLFSYKTFCGEGFIYARGLFVILFVDALIADDEPI